MRFSFLRKAAITIILVALFDRLFPFSFSGAVIGGFAAAWLVGMVLGRTDVRRDRRAWCALVLAGVFAVALVDDPGPLSWALFWCALSVAALMPRTGRFDDAWHWPRGSPCTPSPASLRRSSIFCEVCMPGVVCGTARVRW